MSSSDTAERTENSSPCSARSSSTTFLKLDKFLSAPRYLEVLRMGHNLTTSPWSWQRFRWSSSWRHRDKQVWHHFASKLWHGNPTRQSRKMWARNYEGILHVRHAWACNEADARPALCCPFKMHIQREVKFLQRSLRLTDSRGACKFFADCNWCPGTVHAGLGNCQGSSQELVLLWGLIDNGGSRRRSSCTP